MDFNDDDDLKAWWNANETYDDVIHQTSHLCGCGSSNCGRFWESSDSSDDETVTRLEDFLENSSNASNESDGELRFEESGLVVDINNNTHWTANLDISINNVENNNNTDARVEHDDSENNYNDEILNETDEDTNTIIQDIIDDIIKDIDTENTNDDDDEIVSRLEDFLENSSNASNYRDGGMIFGESDIKSSTHWTANLDISINNVENNNNTDARVEHDDSKNNYIEEILNETDEDRNTITQDISENNEIMLNKNDKDTIPIIEDISQDIDTENTNDNTITVIQNIIDDIDIEPSVDKEYDSGYEGPPNKILKLMTGENLETESKLSALCSTEQVKGTSTNDLGNEPISSRTRSRYTENGPISGRTRSKRKLRDVSIEELLLTDDFIAKNKDRIKKENEDCSNNGPVNKYSKLMLEN